MANNTARQQIKKILAFSKLKTKEQYKIIHDCKQIAKDKEKLVQEFADNLDIHMHCQTDYNISRVFKAEQGFYMSIGRFFSRDTGRHLVWYQLRECVPRYHSIIAADIKTKTVKLTNDMKYYKQSYDIELIRTFKNGNSEFVLNDDLLRLIHDINTIDQNMNIRYYNK